MNKPLNHIAYVLGYLLMPVALASCSVIDEDLSGCDQPGPPPPQPEEPEAEVTYDLRLVTNMTTELRTELTTQADIQLANELRQYLSGIFTDFAHDVDLSFYDTVGDSVLLQKDQHIMDANQASYTLNLPMREYMHLAAANVVDNELVSIANDNRCHKSMLVQAIRDTIDSHETGLFTARQKMEVLGNVSQHFDVHLYMANCAAALVIDPRDHGTVDDVRVFSTGFATGFNICDSTYRYDAKPPIVRTARLALQNQTEEAFCSVTFPSPEQEDVKTRSITETILRVKTPLRAGQLKIIKCWIGEHGGVISRNSEVSTSVTLNWKDGLVIEN